MNLLTRQSGASCANADRYHVFAPFVAKGHQKYFFARRARNLIWALVCQGMLNDPELETRADAFGTKIQFEAGLMQWLVGLAGNRVRTLLSDLVAAEPYREKNGAATV